MTTNGGVTCQSIFTDPLLQGPALQDAVHANFPDGDCEHVSISPHSPGPVDDAELLTRLVVHPIHYDRGIVSPMAFQDATTIDLSVFREAIATDAEIQLSIDEIRALGETRVPPQERLISLVMQASAKDVRAAKFESDGGWMCRVYDTAVLEKPAHASVFTPTVARKGSAQRQVRKELLRIFGAKQLEPDAYRHLSY